MVTKFNKKRLLISVAAGLVFSVLLSICQFNANCNSIRNRVFRIHILANSDSPADQNLKLKVRDKLLEVGNDLFANCSTLAQAESVARKNKYLFEQTAQQVVKQNGYNYSVSVGINKSDFNTRYYKNFTLPAGTYNALTVKIGKANGKNWWCVMFPPVCVPSATNSEISDVLNKKETDIVKNEPKYRCRFKAVEIYEQLRLKIKQKFY